MSPRRITDPDMLRYLNDEGESTSHVRRGPRRITDPELLKYLNKPEPSLLEKGLAGAAGIGKRYPQAETIPGFLPELPGGVSKKPAAPVVGEIKDYSKDYPGLDLTPPEGMKEETYRGLYAWLDEKLHDPKLKGQEQKYIDLLKEAGFTDNKAPFKKWYADQVAFLKSKGQILNPDPYDPRHEYDYEKAYEQGLTPQYQPEHEKEGTPWRFPDIGKTQERLAREGAAKAFPDKMMEAYPFGETMVGEPSMEGERAVRAGGRGIAAGGIGLAETAGTMTEIAGRVFGSQKLMEMGKVASDYWAEKAKQYEPTKDIQGSIYANPELLADPAWWSYNVGNMLPSFAAAMVPAIGAGRYLTIAGRTLGLSEAVIARLASLGASATGGMVGGSLEGASTYREALKSGATPEQAMKAGMGMAAGSALLNALSVGKMLEKLPPGMARKALDFLMKGATEAVTEYLEEPTEIASKYAAGIPQEMADIVEQLKQGLNVMPPSMLLAFLGGGAAGGALEAAPAIDQGLQEAIERAATPYPEAGEKPPPPPPGAPTPPVEEGPGPVTEPPPGPVTEPPPGPVTEPPPGPVTEPPPPVAKPPAPEPKPTVPVPAVNESEIATIPEAEAALAAAKKRFDRVVEEYNAADAAGKRDLVDDWTRAQQSVVAIENRIRELKKGIPPAEKPKAPEAPKGEAGWGLPPIGEFLSTVKKNQEMFRESLGVTEKTVKALYNAARGYHREMVLRAVEGKTEIPWKVANDYFRWSKEDGWEYHNAGGIWMSVSKENAAFLSKSYPEISGKPVKPAKPEAPVYEKALIRFKDDKFPSEKDPNAVTYDIEEIRRVIREGYEDQTHRLTDEQLDEGIRSAANYSNVEGKNMMPTTAEFDELAIRRANEAVAKGKREAKEEKGESFDRWIRNHKGYKLAIKRLERGERVNAYTINEDTNWGQRKTGRLLEILKEEGYPVDEKGDVRPKAAGAPQTPVSEVVEEAVDITDYGQLTTKEMKKYLLDNIDQAIKDQKMGISKGETITIHIPKDGDFTVMNNPEALKRYRDAVQKIFPTTSEKGKLKPAGKVAAVSKGEKRPTGAIGAVSEVGEYVTDGAFALRAKKSQFKIRPSQRDVDVFAERGRTITPEEVQKVIPKAKDIELVSKEEFLYREDIEFAGKGEQEVLGIADFPIALTGKDAINVVRLIDRKGREAYIDQDYYSAIKNVYPDAEFGLSKKDPGESVVAILLPKEKDPIGAIMPLREDKLGQLIKDTREGKFPEIPKEKVEEAKKRDAAAEYEDQQLNYDEMIDSGLNVEYPEIASSVDRYSHGNDTRGITEALENENYEAYKNDLGLALKRMFPEGEITVRRKEGYAGGTGEGFGDYVSVSTNPGWGGEKAKEYTIPIEDVVLAGNTAEGELIVRRKKLKEVTTEIPEEEYPPEEEIGGEAETLESRGPGIRPVEPTEVSPIEVTQEPMKRSDIERMLSEAFDIPIYHRRYRARGALGIFKVKSEVVRLKLPKDIETAAHEIGHALNKFIWPTRKKGLSTRKFRQFYQELAPMATLGDPLKEGFAEFVGFYVTDEAKARRDAPNFYAFFENALEAESPVSRQILLRAREMYKTYMAQTPESRILSNVSFGESAKKAATSDRLITQYLHELWPLEKITKEMADGQKVAEDKDPHILARMMAGIEGKVVAWFYDSPRKYKNYERYGKSLQEILSPIANEIDAFRAYLLARRHIELGGRGIPTGITTRDAQYVISKYKEKFESVQNELVRFQAAGLRYMYEAGVISLKDYFNMRRLNREYVPFYRVVDHLYDKSGKKGYEIQRAPVKYIRGGTGDIIDPLESVIKNTYLFITAAEKNAIGKALVDLSNSKHGMGKYLDPVPYDKRIAAAIGEKELRRILEMYGTWTETTEYKELDRQIRESIREEAGGRAQTMDDKVEQKLLEALTARGWSPAEAQQIIDRVKKAPNAEARNRVIEREITATVVLEKTRTMGISIPDGVHLLWRDSPMKPSGNFISVMHNGKAQFYEVHPDIYASMMAIGRESITPLLKIIGAPTRLLRAGATLSFEFMARNPMRDQMTAFIFSNYGYKPGVDFFRGLYSIWKQDQDYWDWKYSGAEQAAFVSMDRQKNQESIEDVLRDSRVQAIKHHVVRHPIDALRALSEFGEASTRIGEFKRAIKKEGRTKRGMISGGFASREVTLDFRRIGTQGRAINSLIAFWNANMQGNAKLFRSIRDNPTRTLTKIFIGVTLPSILLAIANQDDERVRRLGEWEKWIFWHIPVPGTDIVLRIPKPPLIGAIFGTIPETMVWHMMDNNKDMDIAELIRDIWEAGSPGFMPTIISPFVENYANRSMFLDRPLVPKGSENLLNWAQYSPYTTETAKKLGRLLGQIPIVGDSQLANPIKIENIIQGWTGNLGKMLFQTVDESLKMSGIIKSKDIPEPAKTLSDIPLVRGFVSRYPSFGMAPITKFYRDYDKASRTVATSKMFLREMDVESAMALLDPASSVKLERVKKGLSNARRFIDFVYDSPVMDPGEKRKLIDDTLISMAIMAEVGNDVLSLFRKSLKEREPEK